MECHTTQLADDINEYKISYDTKTLQRDIDMEDGEQIQESCCTYLLQVRVQVGE